MYKYLTILAATLASVAATDYGSSGYGGDSGDSWGSSGSSYGSNQDSYGGGDSYNQGSSYQPPPPPPPPAPAPQYGQCWQGMEQASNWMDSGAVMIANNEGGSNDNWNMIASSMDMYQQNPSPQTHQVTVGVGLAYSPASITAAPGDWIQFNFWAKNHTVTQSSFDKPCVKMEGGMNTGFVPNGENTTNPAPSMKIQVMNSSPMWFYCAQKTPAPHCGSGMVFSVNPSQDKTQDMFSQAAIAQNGSAPAAPVAAPATGAPGQSNVVSGSGSMDNGQCQCQCLCGTNQYSPGYGVGQWGGLPGMMPYSPAPPSGDAPPAPPAPEGAAPPAPAAPAPASGGGGYRRF